MDPALDLRYLGGYFRLKTETVFLYGYRLDDLAAEGFIAGFDVGQVEIGEHVWNEGDEAVAEAMPEIDKPVQVRSHEPGPVNMKQKSAC